MVQSLQAILNSYREVSQTEREKGTYFEELIITYLRNEATYKDLYSDVWTYADWAQTQGIIKKDTGIDLVAKTKGTNEYHAIQCKCYAEDYRIQKGDIDSFFTASGKKPFTHRIIVATTNNWSENAEDALQNQQPPVTKIDLNDLENSQIDWSKYKPNSQIELRRKNDLKPHQLRALMEVQKGFETSDRGKMIMACGTGKTFTSLKIAEQIVGKGKRVLFLVPSLSLLSQTLTEWTQQSVIPLHSFAVCSDSDVGKKRKKDDDIVQTFVHELRYPATTNSKALANELAKRHDDTHMSVVFSTYHSIDVIGEAQNKYGLEEFDLIICDEAHRTTGATFENEDESSFVKVHNNDFIKSKRRLYMTATPRIYGEAAQAKAENDNIELCSMDRVDQYGKEFHVLTFSEAVSKGLLVDYKVIVLTVDEAHISSRLQKLLADENNQLKVDDAAKIVGCWKALSRQDQDKLLLEDTKPMQRAVAFCQVIEPSLGAKTHKVSSKNIASMFQAVVEAYQEQEKDESTLVCEASHIDGSMNATEKESKLKWLKDNIPDGTCRILSNVRCLSEGVDVPALDAVLFLTPRNSQVDVVQSVGRIMRTTQDGKKKLGYVILPVVIPTGMDPSTALNDNKVYKVVWEVLQALRSHDDRFDAMINKMDLTGNSNGKMEVIAITDNIKEKSSKEKKDKKKETGKNSYGIGSPEQKVHEQLQHEMHFEVGEIERALYAKVVEKCGNRHHWEDWAKDIAKIATTHIARISAIVNDPNNRKEVEAFKSFADELRDDLNDSITNDEVIEMLAQHLITKPVFDALFKEYSFASKNPVSQAMQKVLDVLQEHRLEKEADTLERFYASVQMRASDIDSAEGKQKIVVELYDKFFRNAFPRMTERLGIVYTPVEVVDFIINSVNDVLKDEFGQTLGSKGVHIIDPFTGTGTFITRMLQSGLIKPEELSYKYQNEIHANEIVLLAYYIAAVNIEAVYHSIVSGEYKPFEGICLTDTFQLYEKDDLISNLMVDNSGRRKRQKDLDIRVIVGNPPYSEGQDTANDDNRNVDYPSLNKRIKDTYVRNSNVTLKTSLYNSYVQAIRWGSDRIGNSGVLAYVSNAGWIEGNAASGMRKCFSNEFSSIYVFHLRGDARTSGELRRKEKDNVFGQGSRSSIAITVFVKNPHSHKEAADIFFYDIGDYLKKDEKLSIINNFGSINGISGWTKILPDKHGDWINQRDEKFDQFIEIGNKKDSCGEVLFSSYSSGVKTNRDSWCFNFSAKSLANNMKNMIGFYNQEVSAYQKNKNDYVRNNDPKMISWDGTLINDLEKEKIGDFREERIYISSYRPFIKEWLYFDRMFNNSIYRMPSFFPDRKTKNLAINVSGIGAQEFSALMVSEVACLDMIGKGQCFPMYVYENVDNNNATADMFNSNSLSYKMYDGITDQGLKYFQTKYPSETIIKEDIFYYVYGLLHSEDYKTRYADNLSKQLPRIPCVKQSRDFWIFVDAGRRLSDLHVNYETVKQYDAILDTGDKNLSDDDYKITKMKFPNKEDKSVIIYNNKITVRGIPTEAYKYVVNCRSAIEWIMEKITNKLDSESCIVNDANLYATETMNNSKYPLELLLRVITVSIETMKIVKSLPKLDI